MDLKLDQIIEGGDQLKNKAINIGDVIIVIMIENSIN